MKKLEESKTKEVDEIDAETDKKLELFKIELLKQGFFKRLAPYNRPIINAIIGIIVSCIQGCIFPVFGIFITKFLFAMMNPVKEQMRADCNAWALYMFIASLVSLCTSFSQKFAFGVLGENITKHIRRALYSSLLKKSIGWFDDRDNAPGILTSVLASDA